MSKITGVKIFSSSKDNFKTNISSQNTKIISQETGNQQIFKKNVASSSLNPLSTTNNFEESVFKGANIFQTSSQGQRQGTRNTNISAQNNIFLASMSTSQFKPGVSRTIFGDKNELHKFNNSNINEISNSLYTDVDMDLDQMPNSNSIDNKNIEIISDQNKTNQNIITESNKVVANKLKDKVINTFEDFEESIRDKYNIVKIM